MIFFPLDKNLAKCVVEYLKKISKDSYVLRIAKKLNICSFKPLKSQLKFIWKILLQSKDCTCFNQISQNIPSYSTLSLNNSLHLSVNQCFLLRTHSKIEGGGRLVCDTCSEFSLNCYTGWIFWLTFSLLWEIIKILKEKQFPGLPV